LESLVIDLEFDDIDLFESFNVWHDSLLATIGAERVDIFDTIGYKSERDDPTIKNLVNDPDFIKSLAKIGLKISDIQNTDDFQTFMTVTSEFMPLYRVDSSEIDNPVFLLFQTFNDVDSSWNGAVLYSIKDDMKKFYDKLSSKTVEIIYGDINYIYKTSNSANNWQLMNVDNETSEFKKFLTRDEMQKLTSDKKLKITII